MEQLVWASASVIYFRNHPYRNSYRRIVGNEWEFAVDRFNAMKGALDLNPVNIAKEPIFSLKNLTTDWQDRYFSTVEQVAARVYEKAGSRTIYLSYSGGVDSLVVLAALQRHPRYKEFLDSGRFKIFLNTPSIEELPSLFFSTILPNIPLAVANFNTVMSDPDAYLVTGDLGDFIIGTSDIIKLTENDSTADLTIGWENFSKNFDGPDGERYIEMINAAKSIEPFEIESVNQIAWWMCQCYVYQFEIVKPYIWSNTNDLSGLDNDSKVFRFFYDDLFTTFSYEYMSTNPKITGYEDTRKFPKLYAFNHFKDDAILSKVKIYSQRFINRYIQKTSIVKTDTGFLGKFKIENL